MLTLTQSNVAGMTANPGFSETGTTWLGYRRGTGPYWRVLLVMFLAGVATFAQLYAPQAVLPEFGDAFGVPITSAALTVSMATFGLAPRCFSGRL
jgi:YNFM family putative membrane transporter